MLAFRYCLGSNLLYESYGSCLKACAAFPTDGGNEATAGNSVQCRLTYLSAAERVPLPFCGYASASGGGVCQ